MNAAALFGYSVPPSELFAMPPGDVLVLEEAVEVALKAREGGG